jgi:hypothetical protein
VKILEKFFRPIWFHIETGNLGWYIESAGKKIFKIGRKVRKGLGFEDNHHKAHRKSEELCAQDEAGRMGIGGVGNHPQTEV